MIVYKDILGKLKAKGYSSYRIVKENVISQSIVQKIREGKPITTDTLNTICKLTGLQPKDLIEYKKDE